MMGGMQGGMPGMRLFFYVECLKVIKSKVKKNNKQQLF
jgi:hypothetical protein